MRFLSAILHKAEALIPSSFPGELTVFAVRLDSVCDPGWSEPLDCTFTSRKQAQLTRGTDCSRLHAPTDEYDPCEGHSVDEVALSCNGDTLRDPPTEDLPNF